MEDTESLPDLQPISHDEDSLGSDSSISSKSESDESGSNDKEYLEIPSGIDSPSIVQKPQDSTKMLHSLQNSSCDDSIRSSDSDVVFIEVSSSPPPLDPLPKSESIHASVNEDLVDVPAESEDVNEQLFKSTDDFFQEIQSAARRRMESIADTASEGRSFTDAAAGTVAEVVDNVVDVTGVFVATVNAEPVAAAVSDLVAAVAVAADTSVAGASKDQAGVSGKIA